MDVTVNYVIKEQVEMIFPFFTMRVDAISQSLSLFRMVNESQGFFIPLGALKKLDNEFYELNNKRWISSLLLVAMMEGNVCNQDLEYFILPGCDFPETYEDKSPSTPDKNDIAQFLGDDEESNKGLEEKNSTSPNEALLSDSQDPVYSQLSKDLTSSLLRCDTCKRKFKYFTELIKHFKIE